MATSKEQLQIIVDAQGIAKTKAQLKAMDKATGGSTKSFGLMAAGIAGATAALYALGKGISGSIRVGKEFEQSMANVKAISGATAIQFKALEENALRLGATTKFTASEVAGLQTEFSKLGFTATEITKVTKGTLALASATGNDLAEAASVAGETLRGFGLNTSETGRVTDVMAKSFSSSALDMEKFSNSMSYVAPVAKLAGFSIEGTTAIMGKLANAGISGSMAGTSLRKIFLELSNESSKLSKRLGGPIENVNQLIPALKKLNQEGISTAEMKDLVGQRAISAFSILLDGADDLDTLTESFRNAGGSAEEMADIQLDTLEGKLKIMMSALSGLGITIYKIIDGPIKVLVGAFTGLATVIDKTVKVFANMNSEQKPLIKTLKDHEDAIRGIISANDDLELQHLLKLQKDQQDAVNKSASSYINAKNRLDELNNILDNTNKVHILAIRLQEEQNLERHEAMSLADAHIKFLEGEKEQLEEIVNANINRTDGLGEQLEATNRLINSKQRLKEIDEEIINFVSVEEFMHEKKMEQIDDQANKFREAKVAEVDIQKWTARQKKVVDAEELKGKLKHFSNLSNALGSLSDVNSKNAKAVARFSQASAIIDTYAGANKALAQGGMFGWIQAAAIIAAGLANVAQIEKQLGGGFKGTKLAATGMDEVVSKPTMILAGEAGAEQVSITPLEGPNIDGPQGSSVTVNVSGNVLSQDFVEGELAENIKEAVRRGTDFGIS